MALANDNPPVAATDLDNILIGDFLETWRDQRDPFRIRVLALVDLGHKLVVKAGGVVKLAGPFHIVVPGVFIKPAGGFPFGLGGPHFNIELFRQPSGKAHVIGMEVGDDQPLNRPSGQGA
jgi:hypothetical protein